MPERADVSARITSPNDWLPAVLWLTAVTLTALAACLRPAELLPAAGATLEPFVILAAIIVGSALVGRLGLFRVLAQVLVRDRPARPLAAASVLAFTALVSGLINLDVAVVVAMPVALDTARRHHLAAGRVAVAVAVTANAASFLLPTANITSLLLLGRTPRPLLAYLRGSWLAWLLVVLVTVGVLSRWVVAAGVVPLSATEPAPPGRAVLDLIPMFVAASAIRAMLTAGIALRGAFPSQLISGSVLACVVNNLPAAAALRPAAGAGLWAAILAAAIGPNLLLTGSVATLICRRIARETGVRLRAWQFTALGAALVPAQLAVAVLGLHLDGALS